MTLAAPTMIKPSLLTKAHTCDAPPYFATRSYTIPALFDMRRISRHATGTVEIATSSERHIRVLTSAGVELRLVPTRAGLDVSIMLHMVSMDEVLGAEDMESRISIGLHPGALHRHRAARITGSDPSLKTAILLFSRLAPWSWMELANGSAHHRACRARMLRRLPTQIDPSSSNDRPQSFAGPPSVAGPKQSDDQASSLCEPFCEPFCEPLCDKPMLIDASRMTRLTLRSPLFDIAATLSDSGAIRRIDLVADPGQRRPSGPGSLILDDVETNAIILLNAQGHAWRRLGRFRRHIHILRKWTERLKISLAEYVDWRESGRRLDLSQSRAGHRPGTSTR